MARNVVDAVRELILSFPSTEETTSHGTPTFKVVGKTFVYLTLNHHGDQRAAIWLKSPPGIQSEMVRLNPASYFVPPYVGPKGWLGLDLSPGLAWQEIIQRVKEAWIHAAPSALADEVPEKIECEAPDTEMTPEEINPMLGRYAQQVLSELAKRCKRLPETSGEDEQKSATWRAGKRVFVRGHHHDGRLRLLFWTGIEQQAFLIEDPRYSIPMYYGNSGWVELDVQGGANWEDIDSLLEISYRHFALKRMLSKLDAQ